MNTEQPAGNITNTGTLNEAVLQEDHFRAVPFDIPAEANTPDLKRWGFVQTIRHRYEADCDPDALLLVYRQKVQEELERLDGVYRMIRERLEEKIRMLRGRVKELKDRKDLEDPLVAELKKRKAEVEQEMTEIRKRILEIRSRMATAKEDMLDKWLEKAGQQMKKALDLQKQVYGETMDINDKRFKDGQAVFSHYKQQYLERRKLLQERYDKVHEQMKLLGMEGVSPLVANWVLGIGSSVAAAAGYFFSVFTATGKFGNNDTLFYMLSGLMNVAGKDQPGLTIKLLFVFGFVLAMAVVSIGCNYLINRIFPAKEANDENELRFHAAGKFVQDNQRAGIRLKAGNWLALWLQITPAVLLFGVLLVLLGIYDPAGDKIGGLNTSIEGVLAGTAIALGAGAFVYFYIIKIIEPRVQRSYKAENNQHSKRPRHFELVIVLIVFVVCTVAMILVPPGTDKGLPAWFASTIAVTEFIAVALLGGTAIGYALRFKGLFGMDRYLQGQLTRYDSIVAELSAPELPAGGADLSKAMKIMLEQVLAAAAERAFLLRGKVPAVIQHPYNIHQQTEQPPPKKSFSIKDSFGWLGRMFGWKKQEPPSAVAKLVELSEWERRFFPDLDEEIKVQGFEYSERERELRTIETKLDNLNAEREGGQSEKQEAIRNQEIQVEALLTKLEHAAADQLKQRAGLEQNIFRSETAILEGYHLGIWYREAQMGPGSDYFRKGRDPLYFLRNNNQPKLLTYGTH